MDSDHNSTITEADRIIDAVSALNREEVEQLGDAYDSSPLENSVKETCDRLVEEYSGNDRIQSVKNKIIRNSPVAVVKDSLLICYRTLCGNFLRANAFPLRLLIVVLMALIIGTVWLNTDRNSDFVASLFYAYAFISVSAITALAGGLEENELYERDHVMGIYSSVSYVIGHILSGLVIESLLGFAFAMVAFWLVGYDTSFHTYFFYTLIMTVSNTGKAMNMFAVTISPTISGAVAISGGLLSFNMLFCGFFVLKTDIPNGWIWAYWASQWTYGFGSLMVNQFVDVTSNCNFSDTVLLRCVLNANQVNGNTILKKFSLDGYNRYELWAYYVAFFIGTYLLLLLLLQLAARKPKETFMRLLRQFKPVFICCCCLLFVVIIIAIVVPIAAVYGTDDDCDYSYRNPRLDGYCGNPDHPEWGKVGEPFYRWYDEYKYDDEDSLPNPRVLSNRVFNISAREEKPSDAFINALQCGIAQFLVHDFIYMRSNCDNGYIAVPIPKCDPVFDPLCTGEHVMHLCNVEKKNLMTSWIDLSPVYGVSEDIAKVLRRGSKGKGQLAMDEKGYPPLDLDDDDVIRMGGTTKKTKQFLTGDPRSNSNALLMAVHILLLRNHNRLAELIEDRHEDWDDDEIFYTARAINTVSWVNALLDYVRGYTVPGNHILIDQVFEESPNDPKMDDFGMDPIFWVIYRLHPMLPSSINIANTPDSLRANYQAYGKYTIKDTVFKTVDFFNKYNFEDILSGMVSTPAKQASTGIIDDLRNIKYYETLPCEYEPGLFSVGMDMAVVDIMRGRQLNVPRYNDVLKLYGLRPLNTFDQLTDDDEVANTLSDLYDGDINRVEAYVAAHVGNTFSKHTQVTEGILYNLIGTIRRSVLANPLLQLNKRKVTDRDDLIKELAVSGLRDFIILNTKNMRCVGEIANHLIDNVNNRLVCDLEKKQGYQFLDPDYSKDDTMRAVRLAPAL